MYLLFGGTPKVLPDGTRIRGDINILLVGDPGTGKCVSGDSLIVLHDGTICEIRKVVDSTLTQETKHIISDGYYVETNHKLLSLDVNGSITEKVSSIFWKRRCPEYIYEVKTRTGKKIKVTPTHPFFTIKDGSIVPIQASELRTGDFIATPRRLRVFGRPQRLHIHIKRGGTNAARIKIPETTSPELCRILGYLLGEGCCYKASTYHVIFTNRNTELRRDFSYCFEKVFGLTPRSPPSHRGKDLWISSVEVGRFLEKLIPSIFQGAARKEIPEVITRCSDLEIAHLIRAYFDSDATVSTKEREIVITSASEKLLRQVQLLLLRFGVLSQLKEKKVKGRTYFRLRISGEDILNYAKYIGFLHPEKRRRLLSLVSATKTFNTNLDVVPGVYSLIKRIRLKLRLNRSSYTTPSSLKHYENGDRNPSRKCLSNIVDYFTNRLNELIKIRDEIEKAKNWRQLRIIRRKLRLSQKELASIIGVDQTLISQYELGKIRSLNEELLLRAKKIMRKLCDAIILDPEIIMGIARLKMLSDSHIFWDMVSEVKKVKSKDEWVYDMQVDETHNFIANGFFVHNSQLLQYVQRISPRGLYTHGRGTTAAGLTAAVVREKGGGMVLEAGALVLADQGVCAIDEIDKMRPEDRVAMHQAMEQQSYHPSVEILLADGHKARIGDLVDCLIEAEQARVVKGVECEILPLEKPLEILTLDLENLELKKGLVTRVSRHRAPDGFVKLKFSNGRELLVTPEHPIFVFSKNRVETVYASEVKPGDWAVGVSELPINHKDAPKLTLVERVHPLEKTPSLPRSLTPKLARILGYLVSEGYSRVGSSHEVGFVNASEVLLDDFKGLMSSIFDLKPSFFIQEGKAPTLSYVSSMLYRWLKANFPEILKRACEKRAPPSILRSPREITREFLRAAFLGDGGVESEAVCFNTTSRGLAEDYQDLLLKLGISSRLIIETYRTKKGEERTRYKVYVTGDSLARFYKEVVDPLDPRRNRIEVLVRRSMKTLRQHDVLPTDVAKTIVDLMGVLGIPYDGYFNEHFEKGYGVTKRVVERYLSKLSRRLREIEEKLETEKPSGLRRLREILGWSQRRLAETMKVKRSTIDYAERGGYDAEKRKALLAKALEAVRKELDEAEVRITRLRRLMRLRFLRVKDVERIPNEGPYRTEWVYDITVEPTQNFISHGLVLHNSISVAKGGIVATLNARAAILAAANPALGRYDPNRTVAENINLPVTLLSRFDLVFVLKDRPDKERDAKLTEHILRLHGGFEEEVKPVIEPELLRKYISYSKRIKPRMTEEAMEIIKDFYLKMRSAGELADSPIAITARQLESVIRLAEARARVALREEVTAEDAKAAVRLMRASLEQVGIDMATGKIDIDIIMTGKPKSLRDKLQAVIGVIVDLSRQMGMAEEEAVYEVLERDYGISRSEAVSLVEQLRRDGTIYSPRHGFLKKT